MYKKKHTFISQFVSFLSRFPAPRNSLLDRCRIISAVLSLLFIHLTKMIMNSVYNINFRTSSPIAIHICHSHLYIHELECTCSQITVRRRTPSTSEKSIDRGQNRCTTSEKALTEGIIYTRHSNVQHDVPLFKLAIGPCLYFVLVRHWSTSLIHFAIFRGPSIRQSNNVR